ncbi:MAG: hypothetical protein WD749_06450 [Phycisphaerales bacterium]
MSHITAESGAHLPGRHADGHHGDWDLSPANTALPEGAGRTWGLPMVVIGAVLLAATIAAAFADGDLRRHAGAAYLIGMAGVLAASLGAMFFVMVFHLTMAGWSVTIRRQFENVMTLAPLAGVGMLGFVAYEMLTGGNLFYWMTSAAKQDVIFAEKSTYLNPVFFMIRSLVYVLVWAYLAWRLRSYSVEQDATGNRWLSNRARYTSSWGMLAFALCTAFAAFDWLMSLDYRFFSTMWGVYFFAGAAFTSVPVMVLILTWIQGRGRLRGLVTDEHYHDLGKFMFGFTVFWGYIAFSQYFLIWYANIPEETSWMLGRKTGPWHNWTILLAVGHFIVPFWILLWRFMRRTNGLLALMAVWMILMEIADLVWIVRPLVSPGRPDDLHLERLWLDAAGIGGAWLLFFGLALLRAGKGPLIPLRDPRLAEALQHRNYV